MRFRYSSGALGKMPVRPRTSLVVGVALVVLIPFLRKLITDKAEVPAEEMATATVVPVA